MRNIADSETASSMNAFWNILKRSLCLEYEYEKGSSMNAFFIFFQKTAIIIWLLLKGFLDELFTKFPVVFFGFIPDIAAVLLSFRLVFVLFL